MRGSYIKGSLQQRAYLAARKSITEDPTRSASPEQIRKRITNMSPEEVFRIIDAHLAEVLRDPFQLEDVDSPFSPPPPPPPPQSRQPSVTRRRLFRIFDRHRRRDP